ncbi:MAG TPA: toxin-antitoxin system YwqK family antitoxin, partial [Pseudomonas sp.]|nr:toxin-antitoxin system YwqK family antitoxin [Pseudomonas sp.]
REGLALGPAQGFAADGRPLKEDGKPVSRWVWWWRRWREDPP